MVAMEMT